MKKVLLMLLVMVASLTLLGCNDDSGDGEKTEILFWHMSPVGDPAYSGVKQIINDFNDSQELYYVKGVGFSFWDYWDKINVAVASRTAPSIGLSTIDDLVSRAESGVVFNISDLMASDTSGINTLDLDEFRQSQLDFATYEEDLYGMPFTATTRALFYNLDMFEELGLTEDDVPTTWSELETIAKMFDVEEEGSITRLGFDPTYGDTTYHGWLWQTGLDFFDDALNPTLNTQGHLDVLNWILDFNEEFTRSQLTAFGEANALLGLNPFVSERVAMIVSNDGLYQTIATSGLDINYGVAAIPIPDENGTHVCWGSGFSLEMYDNGDNTDAEVAGAYEFYKYLLSESVQLELAETLGWLMSHESAMETYAEGDVILEALLAEVDYAVDKVYVPYAPAWHASDWQTYYTQILDGDLSPEQGLQEARAHYIQKQENYNTLNE
jgi:multiple sugar transport system substrate-binding protein